MSTWQEAPTRLGATSAEETLRFKLPTSPRRRAPRETWVRKSIYIFSAYYIFFLVVLWVPLGNWLPNTLTQLAIPQSLFGFTPPWSVASVYLLGLFAIWIGYIAIKPVAHRRATATISKGSDHKIEVWWRLLVTIGVLAYVVQMVKLRHIPVFNIVARYDESSKLVALISMLTVASAMSVAMWGWTNRTKLLVAFSFIAEGSLGARNLPLGLVVAVLVAMSLYGSKRQFRRGLRWAIFGTALVMMSVGVISKGNIYASHSGSKYDPAEAVAFLQTDSIGTFYNLTELKQAVDGGQATHGKMLVNTFLNLFPWKAHSLDYANFQIGNIVGGRAAVAIGTTTIDRSVSLSASFVGGPYADFGWQDVAITGLICGALWSFFEEFAYARRWFSGLFAFWLAGLVESIYAGPYNDTFMLITVLCLGVIGATMIRSSAQTRTVTELRRASVLGHRYERQNNADS